MTQNVAYLMSVNGLYSSFIEEALELSASYIQNNHQFSLQLLECKQLYIQQNPPVNYDFVYLAIFRLKWK